MHAEREAIVRHYLQLRVLKSQVSQRRRQTVGINVTETRATDRRQPALHKLHTTCLSLACGQKTVLRVLQWL